MRRTIAAAALAIAAAAAVASANVDADAKAFHEWFDGRGASRNTVELAHFPGMGRGIRATDAIKEDQMVFSVPLDSVICRETVRGLKPYRSVVDSVGPDEHVVALFLMREMAKGDKSEWWPYLKVLPKHVPLPAHFNADELAALQDDYVKNQAISQRQELEEEFFGLQKPIEKLFRGASRAARRQWATKDAFFWAMSLVGSRALTLWGKKYMVPFADMYNYQPHAQTREADSGRHFLRYHKIEEGHFRVFADRPVSPGDQLFEDYGDNPNSVYLNHHGFVAEDNPFDCVHLPLPKTREKRTDPLFDRRQRLASRLGVRPPHPTAREQCIHPSRPVSPTILRYFALRSLDADGLAACEVARDSTNAATARATCLPGLRSPATLSALGQALDDALAAFPTTLEQDAALLAAASAGAGTNVGLSDAKELAIRYRMTRKRMLHAFRKRLVPEGQAPEQATPPAAREDELEKITERLNKWIDDNKPPVRKIAAAAIPGYRLAAVATEDVQPEEVYLSVPRSVIMSVETAERSDLEPVISDLKRKYPSGDEFHTLLFHLMHERFVKGPDSFWAPYLDSLPQAHEFHFPLFYTEQELTELEGSHVLPATRKYREQVARKYAAISSRVFAAYPETFDTETTHTFENYRWAHAVLDSRAIWWHGQRHLVPLLDLINCKQGPDPNRIHSTDWDRATQSAVTRAGWHFSAGDQVWENYGQPNHIYFTYHGFVLDENAHDCVRHDESLDTSHPDSNRLRQELQDAGIYTTTQRFCLTAHSLPRDFLEWIRVTERLGRPGKGQTRRKVLKRAGEIARERLSRYATSIADDEYRLKSDSSLGMHALMSIKLRLAEKRILLEIAERHAPAGKSRGGPSAKDEL